MPSPLFLLFFSLAGLVVGLEEEDWLAPASLEGSVAASSDLLREFMGVEAWQGILQSWAAADVHRQASRETFWLPCVSAAYPYTGTAGTTNAYHLDGESRPLPFLPRLSELSSFSTPEEDPHPVVEMPCLLLAYGDGPIFRLPAVMQRMYVGWFWARCQISSLETTILMQWESSEEWSYTVSAPIYFIFFFFLVFFIYSVIVVVGRLCGFFFTGGFIDHCLVLLALYPCSG
jgi:hypothetical protein